MADSKGWEQIEEQITCRMCGELFTDPRTLSCLHTFCKGCLETLVDKKEVRQACCPLCIEPFPQGGVASIETNVAVTCLIELFKKKEDEDHALGLVEVTCTKCEDTNVPVTSWCIQCQSPLCGDCLESHNNCHEFKGHGIVAITEFVQKPKEETCKKHAKQPLKFFCKTCKITICPECAVKGHVQHTFELREVILKENRKNKLMGKAKEEPKDNDKVEMPNERRKDRLYVGKFDYAAVENDELSFKKGDLLYVLNDEGDWWLAETTDCSKEGLIPKNYVAPYGSLESEDWFFGAIRRVDAEYQLLHPLNEHGSFLVRDSEKTPGAYSLSVRDTNIVRHFKIYKGDEGNFYIHNEQCFNSVQELVNFYCMCSNGLSVGLKKPCEIVEQPQPSNIAKIEELETERNSVIPIKRIGAGQFGELWEGTWDEKPVAVKIQPENADSLEFLEEIAVLKELNHSYVIRLLAVCTKEAPIYIVTELMNCGSLLEYIKNSDHSLKLRQKLDMAAQVAAGMAYLETQSVIHCDLAARSILLSGDSDELICKIANFGLAQFLSDDIYEAPSGTRFSPKWAAPEAAINSYFSIKSDVWSFGIFLYELITDGEFPYPGISNAQVVEALQTGYRMPCPVNCPKQLYKIMRDCWREVPINRPTFETLKWRMEDYFIDDDSNA